MTAKQATEKAVMEEPSEGPRPHVTAPAEGRRPPPGGPPRIAPKPLESHNRRDRARRLGETFEPVSSRRFWSDIHHHAINVTWPTFFVLCAAIFGIFNLFFAGLYAIGEEPIANLDPPGFLGLFYFSIETLSTVGFGAMYPRTEYGHLLNAVEIFVGMVLMAVLTGLVFTRFSKPRARMVFARHPVITKHQGTRTLMIRLANERNNTIIGASAKLWLARNERSAEGLTLRVYRELPLFHGENPSFSATWMVFHEIVADSPLAHASREALAADAAALILTVGGVDETTLQDLNARRVYPMNWVRWNHHYADILSTGPDGRVKVDHTKFHEVQPDRR